MNYQAIYNQIVDRAKDRQLTCYKERHHILPRCMGGSNKEDNLVELTAREHFLVHWILVRIHPDNNKLKYAFWGMCNQKSRGQEGRYIPTSRTYLEARELFSKTQSENMIGSNNPQYGKGAWNRGIPATTTSNIKRSQAMSGERHFMYGKHHSSATIEKLKGAKTEKHKEAMRGTRKPYGPQKVLTCPYCSKEGGNSMKRWHFENCRDK